MDPIPYDSLVTVLSGGATGLLGALVSRVSDHISERSKNKFDMEYLKLQIEANAKESTNRIEELRVEAETGKSVKNHVEELEPKEVFGDSYEETSIRMTKKHSDWFVMVDVIRGVIRPLLTVLLCLMTFLVWVFTTEASLKEQTVMTILYMSTTAVLWWFGTRPSNKGKSNG